MAQASRLAEVLRDARQRVAKGWTHVLARYVEREPTPAAKAHAEWHARLFGDVPTFQPITWPRKVMCVPEHPEACEWSLQGALVLACGEDVGLQLDAEEFLGAMAPGRCAMTWSQRPERTQAEVLALLAKAITRADGMARQECA